MGDRPAPLITLFFKRSDDPLNFAILLRAMRRDELLVKTVAANQSGVAATRVHEPLARPEQERRRHSAQGTKPVNQCRLQSAAGGSCLATAGQVLAQLF